MKIIERGTISDAAICGKSPHAISLVKFGEYIYSFWFSGTQEGKKDVDLYFNRYSLNERKWEKTRLFLHDEKRSLGNTIPIVTEEGSLRVYFAAMEGKRWTESTLWSTEPDFENPEEIKIALKSFKNDWGSLFGNRIIKLKNGEYILPLYDEVNWEATPLISNDLENWNNFGILKTPKGCMQPSIVELNDGNLLCLLRTRDGYIYKTTFLKEKNDWETPTPINIFNPNSRLDLIRFNGKLILCCNPTSTPENPAWKDKDKLSLFVSDMDNSLWGKRNILSLFVSEDEGRSWKEIERLEENEDGEFSYPWMEIISETSFMLAYTNERESISYCIIEA